MTGTMYLIGDAAGFEGDPEAIARRRRRDYRNWSFGVSAEESLQEIGLFGFCWKARRGAAALDVADNEGEFDGDGEAESFCLEGHAGAGRGGDAECAGVGRADSRSDGGDFVFS